jgi:hypothetical protein
MKVDRRKYPRKTDATYCLYTKCEECVKSVTCLWKKGSQDPLTALFQSNAKQNGAEKST